MSDTIKIRDLRTWQQANRQAPAPPPVRRSSGLFRNLPQAPQHAIQTVQHQGDAGSITYVSLIPRQERQS